MQGSESKREASEFCESRATRKGAEKKTKVLKYKKGLHRLVKLHAKKGLFMNSKQLQTAEGFTFPKGSNVVSGLIFIQYSFVNQTSPFALFTTFLVTHTNLYMFYKVPTSKKQKSQSFTKTWIPRSRQKSETQPISSAPQVQCTFR